MKLKRSVLHLSDSMREARREMARGGLVCREVAGGQARDAKRLQAPEDLGEGGRARIHAADRYDAQFVLARSYGFERWLKLNAAVDAVTSTTLHLSAQRGDLTEVHELLTRRRELGRGEMRACKSPS